MVEISYHTHEAGLENQVACLDQASGIELRGVCLQYHIVIIWFYHLNSLVALPLYLFFPPQ